MRSLESHIMCWTSALNCYIIGYQTNFHTHFLPSTTHPFTTWYQWAYIRLKCQKLLARGVGAGVGVSIWNGNWVNSILNHHPPPFSCPPGCSLRLPFCSHFFSSSFRFYIYLKSQLFGKFSFQSFKNWGKVQFISLKFYQTEFQRLNSRQKLWSFWKSPNLTAVHSLSFYFWPFGLHTQYTDLKVEDPTGSLHIHRYLLTLFHEDKAVSFDHISKKINLCTLIIIVGCS